MATASKVKAAFREGVAEVVPDPRLERERERHIRPTEPRRCSRASIMVKDYGEYLPHPITRSFHCLAQLTKDAMPAIELNVVRGLNILKGV